ncbi:hypothetical protein J2R96_008741 [Bradyrhizobium elkanii]|nr:hypothetical protein [Bradyrhizobium elkanii]
MLMRKVRQETQRVQPVARMSEAICGGRWCVLARRIPDVVELVIGRAFARPRWLILRATGTEAQSVSATRDLPKMC